MSRPIKGLQGVLWKDLPDSTLVAVLNGFESDLRGEVRSVSASDAPMSPVIPYPTSIIYAAMEGIYLERARRGTAPPPRRLKLTRATG